jgi:hypothetical protein
MDISQQPPQPPSSQPVDIFAESDSQKNLARPRVPQPPLGNMPSGGPGMNAGHSGLLPGVKWVLVGVGVLIVGLIVWKLLPSSSEEVTQTEVISEDVVQPIQTSPQQPTAPSEPTSSIPTIELPPDADGDGLTDTEEANYGTDISKSDTDGDGLSDSEEVRIYFTNPTNPDTDGDGFTDGDEVKKGYNPKGPGKLFEIPTAQ